MRISRAAIALFTTVALAGCGGGGLSPKTTDSNPTSASSQTASTVAATGTTANGQSGLTATVEAICARRNAAAASDSATISNQPALRHLARLGVSAETQSLRELDKLTPPTTLEPAWQKWIAAKRALVKAWAKFLREGPDETIGGVFQTQDVVLTDAKRLGFKACVQTK